MTFNVTEYSAKSSTVASGEFSSQLSHADQLLTAQTLASFEFGAPGVDQDPRRVNFPLPVLKTSGGSALQWLSSEPEVVSGRTPDGLAFAHSTTLCMAHLTIPADEILSATQSSYERLEAFLLSRGFTEWVRVWNFLGAINLGDGDAERYREFCRGRAEAVGKITECEGVLPAATAIGCDPNVLVVVVFASKQAGISVENPRQIAAWRYPRQYGPKSPSFARAMLVPHQDCVRLLVSGTASVVGHQTLHPTDAVAQLHETQANLAALLQHAASTHADLLGPGRWQAESFTLYLRHANDAEHICPLFAQSIAQGAPWVAVRGDICRSDLLLEVEGVYRWCKLPS